MVLDESMLDDFYSRLGFLSCPVSTLEQLILARLIDGGDFQRHINRVRRKKRIEMQVESRKKDIK